MRAWKSLLLTVAVAALSPGLALAQATLAGVVRDSSGGLLPGVTVEATSPALIEKVRTAVTDGSGRYQIVDLRPGPYVVSFSLAGFNGVKLEGIVLSGTLTTTADTELRPGGVQETITVSGDAPLVNLQSTARQAVLDQEIVAAIPSSRTPFTVGVLIPGVKRGAFMGQDVGGSVVQEVASLEANGGRTADQRMMVNGVALSSMIAGGWGGGAVPNASGTSEFAIDVSGVDAQAATGGVRINFIPRDGGNRFSGTVFGSYARESFAGDNFTGSDVQARGLAAPGKIKGNGDFNPGFGGPLVRDRLWFFLSGRYLYADNFVPAMFFNENANRLDRTDYVRSSRQAIVHQDQQIIQGRFTWQANEKNKIGITYDQENFCACPAGGFGGLSPTVSPEAAVDRRFPLQRFVQADWSNPLSNKVLLEASAIHRVERWGGMHPQTGKGENIEALTPGIVSITDNPNPVTGGMLTYRSAAEFNNSWNWNIHYRAAVSYITGSHNFKVGFNNAYGYHENTTYMDPAAPYAYTFAAGLPQSITYRIPRTIKANVDRDLGLFAQDRWTTGRWTLSGGIRYDHFKNSFPEQAIVGTFFGRGLNVQFPHIDNLNWHDITPKLGATYDVFGTGKTAIKITLNKYLEGLGTTGGFGSDNVSDAPNPIRRLSGINVNSSRPWGDTDLDFVPDCNLNDFDTNGECGPLDSAATFGTLVPGTTYDPDLLEGWGKRGFNWELTAGVQHEVAPRIGVDVQYARRWYGNIRTTDDRSLGPTDYDRFTITVPNNPDLPGGGGYTLTAFDLKPEAVFRPVDNFVTLAKHYGEQTDRFDGLNVNVNARLQNGVMVQGGVGTGRVVTNDCEVVEQLPELLHSFLVAPTRLFFFAARPAERCEQNNGWRTQVQGFASYMIPTIDVQISGTFQNLPGVAMDANANTCSGPLLPFCAATTTTLGRPFSFGPFRSFNIVPAGEVFVERLNQFDLRVSKIFRVVGTRTHVNFDFYNVLNSNDVLSENTTFGPTWRQPQTILVPRLFKISAQFDL